MLTRHARPLLSAPARLAAAASRRYHDPVISAAINDARLRQMSSASASAEHAVTVYLDVKSPHAYLILQPALQIAADYNVTVDFKPYQLDFVEMGISLKSPEDPSNPEGQRESPSAQSDRRARMFYSVARDYAALQGIGIRGPYKLLRSRLGNLAFLYARGESEHNFLKVEAEFLKAIFDAGWPNGWREYDMEDPEVLKSTLAELGADPSGFDEYIEEGGEGDQAMAEMAAAAEASGAVGVPHVEWQVPDKKNGGLKTKGMFGREHLSLIRLQLHEHGLARRDDVEAHISHAYVTPA